MYIFNAGLFSSLEKIFSGDRVFPEGIRTLSLLRGERSGFQLAVRTNADEVLRVTVDSPVKATLFRVNELFSTLPINEDGKNITLVGGGKPGLYPDLLTPCGEENPVKADTTSVFWIQLDAGNVSAGDYTVKVCVCGENTEKTFELSVPVIDAEMPQQTLLHINWFHTDCLADFYKVKVFSEEYWRIVENFATNALAHGVNVLFTPLFTPPLDTQEGGERTTVQLVGVTKKRQEYFFDFSRLDRWVEMAHRIGFEYFEFSHLFTQWGAKHAPKIIADTLQGERRIFGWETKSEGEEYTNFLRQFGKALSAYTDEKGITDKCFIHCSDEPSKGDLQKYKRMSAMLKQFFGPYKQIDALSDYAFYKSGAVDIPVTSENEIEDFAGRVPELWTYYCSGQYKNELPNRFFSMPSIKNRILGTLLYKYDCKGFLHWGFNFYNSQFSVKHINPFDDTDSGGAYPSGDAFIVYPGENGEPLTSLRQQVFYDGIEDYEALKLLESLTSRDETLKLIEAKLGKISFTSYPLDTRTFREFRDAVNIRIAEADNE